MANLIIFALETDLKLAEADYTMAQNNPTDLINTINKYEEKYELFKKQKVSIFSRHKYNVLMAELEKVINQMRASLDKMQ